MKNLGLALCMALIAAPVLAEEQSEGRALAELSFESADTKERGYVDMGQMEEMRQDVFYSMDADDNGKLSEPEFLEWGYGFQNIAEEDGKTLAYNTALKVVFSFWDRNNDGAITPTEHRKAIIADFQRADLNSDAVLNKSEFLGGFSVLVAIRAALKP